jgi:hypothetical protein
MAGCIAPRVVSGLAICMATLGPALPVAAQTEQRITICQVTGSTANPWVFTTIDARDLPEHLARGDYRANSIADCPGASAAATSLPTIGPTPAATATPVRAAATSAATATPVPAATLAATATGVPTSSPAARPPDVAGAQATPQPEVSTLPRGGGEPDRPTLVLVLLGLFAAGYGLIRLGRGHV